MKAWIANMSCLFKCLLSIDFLCVILSACQWHCQILKVHFQYCTHFHSLFKPISINMDICKSVTGTWIFPSDTSLTQVMSILSVIMSTSDTLFFKAQPKFQSRVVCAPARCWQAMQLTLSRWPLHSDWLLWL
jgi:hypothetical protein